METMKSAPEPHFKIILGLQFMIYLLEVSFPPPPLL